MTLRLDGERPFHAYNRARSIWEDDDWKYVDPEDSDELVARAQKYELGAMPAWGSRSKVSEVDDATGLSLTGGQKRLAAHYACRPAWRQSTKHQEWLNEERYPGERLAWEKRYGGSIP